jgi:hypothetical protein
MTRGQMVIILPNNKVLTSIEFNGDMYFEGLGQEAFLRLLAVNSEEKYLETVKEFNTLHYGYKENLTYPHPYDSLVNMKNYGYFDLTSPDCWFSDYLYIKNISGNTQHIETHECSVDIENGGVCVLNFEECEPHYNDGCQYVVEWPEDISGEAQEVNVDWSIDIEWPEDISGEAQEQVINQIFDQLQNGFRNGSARVKY